MKKKPIIGITPLYNKRLDTIWILSHYFDMIKALGGLPIMLPFACERKDMDQLLDLLDGVVFTGGQDVNPSYYNEKPKPELGNVSDKRDRFEWNFLDFVLESKIPVLFICRGLQIINVKMGGSLYQDIKSQVKTEILKHSYGDDRAQDLVHKVIYQKGSKFDYIFEDEFEVNSLHHQAVKDLGKNLRVNLLSEDGIVEGLEMTDRPFGLAFQFHPELIFEKQEVAKKAVKEFIKAAGDYK